MLRVVLRATTPIALVARALGSALLLACVAAEPTSPPPSPAQPPDALPGGWRTISDSGRLAGQLAPESGAIAIGRFQSWILELRAATGAPVTAAAIAIAGGMPGHGHGLPTQPQVTEELGSGRYRIEGVKLNMVGAWVIEVFVQTAAGRDRLRFDLAIDY
jgi:hypothetical protein